MRWCPVAAAAVLLVLPGVGGAAEGPSSFVISISPRAPAGFVDLSGAQLEFSARDAESGATTFSAVIAACPKDAQSTCSSVSFPQLKTTLTLVDADLDPLRGYVEKELGQGAREGAGCILLVRDASSQKVLRTYTFSECFPVAFTVRGLDGGESGSLTETITLAVEDFEEA